MEEALQVLVKSEKSKIITVPSQLDGNQISLYKEKVDTAFSDKIDILYLDCSDILQVSSMHINVLWESISSGIEKKIKVQLVNANDSLKKVLKVLDLFDHFLGDPDDNEPAFEISGTVNTNILGQKIELQFPPLSNSVAQALAQYKEFLVQLELNSNIVIELETIFYEVSTNIANHSNLDVELKISFEAEVEDNGIVMKFVDSGDEFDPASAELNYEPEQFIANKIHSGLGLVMIKKMSDNLSYKREDGKNMLIVEKKWN